MHYPALDHYSIARIAQELVYVYKVFSATHSKQLLVFVKCALCDLKYSHVIDSEASDLLRVT